MSISFRTKDIKLEDLEKLRLALREFAAERDWEQFHTPKNLAAALSVEAAELLEIFQWMSDTQSRTLGDEDRKAVADEIADVLMYLVRISDVLNINLSSSVEQKLAKNREKYPIEQAKGSSAKYTKYQK